MWGGESDCANSSHARDSEQLQSCKMSCLVAVSGCLSFCTTITLNAGCLRVSGVLQTLCIAQALEYQLACDLSQGTQPAQTDVVKWLHGYLHQHALWVHNFLSRNIPFFLAVPASYTYRPRLQPHPRRVINLSAPLLLLFGPSTGALDCR
jgi:hypothetical protein